MDGNGNKNKYRLIAAQKAYDLILDTVIKYDWQQQMTLSVPKITLLFSKTQSKTQDIIQGTTDEINNDDMKQMDIGYAKEEEQDMEDLSFQDI